MKYLIVSDLDGTLLYDHLTISSLTVKAIQAVEKLGHKFLIATGRPNLSCLHFYEKIASKNLLITSSGAKISNPGDSSFKEIVETIPLECMYDFYDLNKNIIVSACYNHDDEVYITSKCEEMTTFFRGILPEKIYEISLSKATKPASCMIVAVKDVHRQQFENSFADNDTITARFWGSNGTTGIFEVYLRKLSKASAILHAAEYYGIDPKNTICFGDGVNDVEMIATAGIGVAVENAIAEVKDVADVVLKLDNTEDAVAHYLIDFFDLKLN